MPTPFYYHVNLIPWPNPWCFSSDDMRESQLQPAALRRFIAGLDVAACDRAIMATMPGVGIIGCMRYTMAPGGRLEACGTWVAPAYRRRGVATSMWDEARRSEPLESVCAMAVTRAGQGFLRAMANTWPGPFGLVES